MAQLRFGQERRTESRSILSRNQNGVAGSVSGWKTRGGDFLCALCNKKVIRQRETDKREDAIVFAEMVCQIRDLRDTVRMLIGKRLNIPWKQITEMSVDNCLNDLKHLKRKGQSQ